ncbi:STAS domain-containing protein [bacterium]|nr:STAS domain-containing protein [bacterium]
MSIEIEVFKHHLDILEMKLSGDLDTYTSAGFAEKLSDLIELGADRIVLNFTKVTYVSSLGIGEIIQGWDRLRTAGGALKFACMSDGVYKVFKLVGLTTRFEIFSSLEDALRSF